MYVFDAYAFCDTYQGWLLRTRRLKKSRAVELVDVRVPGDVTTAGLRGLDFYSPASGRGLSRCGRGGGQGRPPWGSRGCGREWLARCAWLRAAFRDWGGSQRGVLTAVEGAGHLEGRRAGRGSVGLARGQDKGEASGGERHCARRGRGNGAHGTGGLKQQVAYTGDRHGFGQLARPRLADPARAVRHPGGQHVAARNLGRAKLGQVGDGG